MNEQLRKLIEVFFFVSAGMMLSCSYIVALAIAGHEFEEEFAATAFWITAFTSPVVFFVVMSAWKYQWPFRVNWFIIAFGLVGFSMWMLTLLKLVRIYSVEGVLSGAIGSAFAVPVVLGSVLAFLAVKKSFKDPNFQAVRKTK